MAICGLKVGSSLVGQTVCINKGDRAKPNGHWLLPHIGQRMTIIWKNKTGKKENRHWMTCPSYHLLLLELWKGHASVKPLSRPPAIPNWVPHFLRMIKVQMSWKGYASLWAPLFENDKSTNVLESISFCESRTFWEWKKLQMCWKG